MGRDSPGGRCFPAVFSSEVSLPVSLLRSRWKAAADRLFRVWYQMRWPAAWTQGRMPLLACGKRRESHPAPRETGPGLGHRCAYREPVAAGVVAPLGPAREASAWLGTGGVRGSLCHGRGEDLLTG